MALIASEMWLTQRVALSVRSGRGRAGKGRLWRRENPYCSCKLIRDPAGGHPQRASGRKGCEGQVEAGRASFGGRLVLAPQSLWIIPTAAVS